MNGRDGLSGSREPKTTGIRFALLGPFNALKQAEVDFQDLAVKNDQRIEGLVLGCWGEISIFRQVREKSAARSSPIGEIKGWLPRPVR